MAKDDGTVLTHSLLKKMIFYDEHTGIFKWIHHPSPRARMVGKEAGSLSSEGYVNVRVFGKQYKGGRLAWFWMTGSWPKKHDEIDHKNLNKSDNRWNNLRIASLSQNRANTPLRSHNTSGRKGVSWKKQYKKWQATIRVDGIKKHLGYTDDIEDAARLYSEAAKHYFGDFSNG